MTSERALQVRRVLEGIRRCDASGTINLAKALPLIFRLRGKPYSLHWSHFMFEPLFKAGVIPRRLLIKSGRQVAKSTGLACSQVLRTMLMPNYNILTVMPLFEQVRKFSQNYVRPFITTSTTRSRIVSPLGTDSVLQRAIGPLDHNSNLFYSYSSGDPSRVRGIPADECLSAGTMITLCDGTARAVESLQPGDVILSITAQGVEPDTVVRLVYKGTRPTWRVHFSDGGSLTATDNELLATDDGWGYLANVAYRSTDATAIGNTVRGWESFSPQRVSSPAIPRVTLPGTTGVLSPQVPDTGKPGSYPAANSGEQGVRQPISKLHHSNFTAVNAADGVMLQQLWQETGSGEVAGTADQRGHSISDSGRRIDGGRGNTNKLTRILTAGESATDELADCEGLRRYLIQNKGILVCEAVPRRLAAAGNSDRTIHSAEHALQAVSGAGVTDDDLRALWQVIPGQQQPSLGMGEEPSMSGSRVLALAKSSTQPEVCFLSTEPGQEERSCSGKVSPEYSRRAREAQARSTDAFGREEGGIERSATCLESSPQVSGLVGVTVISVEYAGEQPVYDVETRHNHSFFANGYGVHNCSFDEIQDLDHADLPIVESCMGASPYKIVRYTGTPKTFDNTMNLLWEDTSQAQWHIICSCGKYNRAAVDGDLLKMIGDNSQRPNGDHRTLICAACGNPLNSRNGFYVHDFPERQLTFPGYHIPQPILPMHYESPKDWEVLLETQREKATYVFYNEVLGESYDSGAKMLTQEDLRAAATVEPCDPQQTPPGRYIATMEGVDWGGRGKEKTTDTEDFISNTALAIGGMLASGVIEIFWLHKVPYAVDMGHESKMVANVAAQARCDYVAMDYGGQGNVQEAQVRAHGWPIERVIPFTYAVMAPTRPIVFYNPPSHRGVRSSYTLDKPRSLLLLAELIKRKLVLLPQGDRYLNHFLRDFLALYEESIDNPSGSPRRLVKRMSRRTDDVAHAINFVVMGLYHQTQRWPAIAQSFIEAGL